MKRRSAKPSILVRLHPDHHRAAVAAATAIFPPGNRFGVFGFTIQRKRVRGRTHAYSTLTVFVERKYDQPTHPIEPIPFRSRRVTYSVLPDVVATGSVAAAGQGFAPVFTGLHPGASIRVDVGHRCAGGVACLLGSTAGPTHLLTAGHLFPPGTAPFPVTAAPAPGAPEVVVGRLAHNFLDTPPAGHPMDVALIALTPQGVQMAIQSALHPRYPVLRPLSFDSRMVDWARLKVFLPKTNDYQAAPDAKQGPNVFHLVTHCRPPHSITNVIVTAFANNTDGNSGTILMTDEDESQGRVVGSAVGIAVGYTPGFSLHEPVDRALRAVRSATGKNLEIWSQAS
jgi:hypothetical protein